MSIANYAELKTAVANFMARSDLTNQIPDFITMAESRMSRELETREQEKRSQATLVAGDEYILLPNDFREVREVKINASPTRVLTYYSPSALDSMYSSNGEGMPEGYSIVGLELKMRPIPDAAYTQEIVYIGSLPNISNTTTPILFTRSPDLYLYGALAEGYAYLLDEARAAQYDQKFTRILEEIKVDEQRSHYGTGSLQIKSAYSQASAIAER
jgi:hypothetical protein|tara:strand:- start:430 stop:1071 length:642 start_codon:yes stop_codon:yes gene_type:complete